MATAPKALEPDDDARRAYFPAPHRETRQQPRTIDDGPDHHEPTDDGHDEATRTGPRGEGPAGNDLAGTDDEDVAMEETRGPRS